MYNFLVKSEMCKWSIVWRLFLEENELKNYIMLISSLCIIYNKQISLCILGRCFLFYEYVDLKLKVIWLYEVEPIKLV